MSAAAVAVLTGCRGGDGEKTSVPTASASPAASRAAAVPTMDEVRRDIRAAVATGGFEGLNFVRVDPEVLRRNPCQLLARVETPAVPRSSAVAEVTGELKLRGWQVSGPYDSGDGQGFGYSVTRKPWNPRPVRQRGRSGLRVLRHAQALEPQPDGGNRDEGGDGHPAAAGEERPGQ
ncbi:hypothetical protein [Streptomyces griseosporeus]